MFELFYNESEEQKHVLYSINEYPHLWCICFKGKAVIPGEEFIENLLDIAAEIDDQLFSDEIATVIYNITEFKSTQLMIKGNVASETPSIDRLKELVSSFDYDKIIGEYVNATSFIPVENSKDYFQKYKTQYKKEYSIFNNATNILIIVNTVIFIFNFLFGYIDIQLLVAQSSQNPLMVLVSIFAAGFTHASIMHVGFNMLFLHSIGEVLEHILGKGKFLLLYMLSMLCSGLFVYFFSAPLSQTVGASGALFGLFGFFIIYILRYSASREVKRNVLTTFAINIIITFTISGISIMGHLGGLIFGVVFFFINDSIRKR